MIGDFTNTHTPTLCRCTTCGKEVSPRLTSIRQGQGPCLFCGEGGFDGTLPGSVYLLRHDGHGALKVGITNDRIGRLAQHEREGWSLIDLWSFDLGANAEAVENAVLAAWKKHPHGVAAEDMPQRGHTETVSFDDVTEAEALHLIEMAVVDIPVGATGERTR
jgi:hypothetical protein